MKKCLDGRYLVFTRYPDGIDGKWFYQKDCPAHAPSWIKTQAHVSQGGKRTINYVTGADAATLAWLGNQACIEVHSWLSRTQNLLHPDWAVFDLDPAPPAGFAEAVHTAWLLKDLLDDLNLSSCVKTSGGAGLHVYVPVRPIYTYQQTRDFVHAIGRILQKRHPDHITLQRPVAQRTGKVYIDYLQNGAGKTMAAPYSPRPLARAPVSVPLTWSMLTSHKTVYGITNVEEWLGRGDEAFWSVLCSRQVLPALR